MICDFLDQKHHITKSGDTNHIFDLIRFLIKCSDVRKK